MKAALIRQEDKEDDMLRNSTAMALAPAVLAGPALARAEWTFADVSELETFDEDRITC